MQELVVNKTFNTREELEQYVENLKQNYIVFMVMEKDQEIGKTEIYGIDKVLHFGIKK